MLTFAPEYKGLMTNDYTIDDELFQFVTLFADEGAKDIECNALQSNGTAAKSSGDDPTVDIESGASCGGSTDVMDKNCVITESTRLEKRNTRSKEKACELRYGKKRLSPGFKKYSLSENTDLFRVTFKCGLDRHGSPCEHRIGIFHTLRDDVQRLGDGEYLYNGRKLGWGNVVPAIDKRTQGKLAQTWRAHFAKNHGWDKTSDNLPIECRLKAAR